MTLTAAASAGAFFAGWSGACSGKGACAVTLSSSQSVTATFETNNQTGNFTDTALNSTCGYTATTDSTGRVIDIMKGADRIYSHTRTGQGTWNVAYNQVMCESAVIVERGVPLAGPTSDQEITLVKLGTLPSSGRRIGGASAHAFGPILQSPDGRILAIDVQRNQTSNWGELEYYKTTGFNEGARIQWVDLSRCDGNLMMTPVVKIETNNWAAAKCKFSPEAWERKLLE